MIYRNSAGEVIVNGKANSATTADSITGGVTTYTSNIVSKDGGPGSIGTQSMVVWGKVVVFTLRINHGGTVGNDGNYFHGYLQHHFPANMVFTNSNWYEHMVQAWIKTTGEIRVYINDPYSSAFDSSDVNLTFTYLTT